MLKSLHEPDDQLELYALDRLQDDAVERIEEHLIICDPCRLRLEEVGSFALSIRQALRTQPVLKPHRRAGWFEGWQLRFAFSGAIALAVLLAFFAVKFGNRTNLPPVASLTLTAMRGTTATVSPAREIDLLLADAPTGVTSPAEVVDAEGKAVWSGSVQAVGPATHLRITKELAPGTYFVRLKRVPGELLREYAFNIR